jgi:asparagine synthase (glutamine-hydrolysing)
VAFSSELKSLMEIPELSRKMDVRLMEDYLALGHIPEPRTIFSDMNKLFQVIH